MKLRSSNKAGAKVLGTKWKLPELRSVLGEAWSGWSTVGAGEESGGNELQRGEFNLVNQRENERSEHGKGLARMLIEQGIELWLTGVK